MSFRTLSRLGASAVVVLLARVTPARAQVPDDPPPLEIRCLVTDGATGRPVPGVSVIVRTIAFAGATDSLGWLRIPLVEGGGYLLEVSRNGYEGAVGVVQVDSAVAVAVHLMPLVAGLAEDPSAVFGEVRDAESGEPLQGVMVSVDGPSVNEAISGEGGGFVLQPLDSGTYRVVFERMGYARRELSLSLDRGQRAEIVVPMGVEPIPLDPVKVVVERRSLVLERSGFYQRRKLELGQFLSLDQIEGRTVSRTSDLFNDLRGIRFMERAEGGREEAIVFHRGQGVVSIANPRRICYPAVWIDGVQVAAGGDEAAVLNRYVKPTEIAGIEAYASASQVPVQYSGTGRACGVILVWTKG